MCNILHIKTDLCTMSESETTSDASKWKVIRGGEAGRRGARWEKVTVDLTLAVKGLVPLVFAPLLFSPLYFPLIFAHPWKMTFRLFSRSHKKI